MIIKKLVGRTCLLVCSCLISIQLYATPLCSNFADNFNRPDGVVDNGWSNSASDNGADLVIKNDRLSTPEPIPDQSVSTSAAIIRPICLDVPVTLTATLTPGNGFGGLQDRYAVFFRYGTDDFGNGGVGVGFARSDQDFANSNVQLDNQRLFSTFQFGSSISVIITFNPDTSIIGSVFGDGNEFDFSSGPTGEAFGGNDFLIGMAYPDARTSVITDATVDDVNLVFGNVPEPNTLSSATFGVVLLALYRIVPAIWRRRAVG